MSIFDYNSKPMRFLNALSDALFINLLFVLCSLPVVTMGAAQAGLYTAAKVFRDKEDDSSCIKAFFRGFAAGFWRITVVWCGLLLLGALFIGNLIRFLFLQTGGQSVWLFAAAALLVLMLQPLTVQFHARYVCTPWQLLKNGVLFLLGNPLRAALVAVLVWLPLGIALVQLSLFTQMIPVFLLIYFSIAYLLSFMLMEKPFQRMVGK